MNKIKLLLAFSTVSSIIMTPSVLAADVDPYAAVAEWFGVYVTTAVMRSIFVLLLIFAIFYILMGRVFSATGGIEKRERQVLAFILAAVVAYYSHINPFLSGLWEMMFSFGVIPIAIFLVFLFLATMIHHGRHAHAEAHVPMMEKKVEYYEAKSRLFDIQQQHLTKKEQKETKIVGNILGDAEGTLQKVMLHRRTPLQLKEEFIHKAPKIRRELQRIKVNIIRQEKQLRTEINTLQSQSKTIRFAKSQDEMVLKTDIRARDKRSAGADSNIRANLQNELSFLNQEYRYIMEELRRAKMIEKIVEQAEELTNYVISAEARWGLTDTYIKQIIALLDRARKIDISDEKIENWRRKVESRIKNMDNMIIKRTRRQGLQKRKAIRGK